MWLLVALFPLCLSAASVSIERNAYRGVSVRISHNVQEREFKLEKLKAVLSKSSELLFRATRGRAYFGEFVISIPTWWSTCTEEDLATQASPEVDVHVTHCDRLTTKHSRGCGAEGERIDVPLEWLNGNSDVASLAHQFVQQWSIYRYGVFEEKPVIGDSCHFSGKFWTPVGCFDINFQSEPAFESGLPSCSLPSGLETELRSSLMSDVNSSKVLDFCDGSLSLPHNPVMPTLHNKLCKGRSVWSVIQDSLDFKYGKNLALKAARPPKSPTFKCYREEPLHVIFAIQNNTVRNLPSEVMTQLVATLFEFLWNMAPKDSNVTVVTFSDKKDLHQSFSLDITNAKYLYEALQYGVKTFRAIYNVCLSCGLQKALNAAQSSSSFPIVIFIAWKSALIDQNPSVLVESVKDYPPRARMHFIFVEDIETVDIPTDMISAIRLFGGQIYSLPEQLVFRASRLLAILASVVKNPAQVEDKIVVVHEKNYWNISQNFVDSFAIPPRAFGKMFYAMYCSPKVDSIIRSDNENCTSLSAASNADSTFKCGNVWNFDNVKVSGEKWEYPFSYFGTPDLLHCSSVAMLLSSASKNHFSLRGWLSTYVIKVRQEAVIIFAEITASIEHKFNVEAQIFGPGLKYPVSIELRDNGNGDPDTKAGDGIYSRYFTKFTEKGIYTVSVSAELSMIYGSNLFMAGQGTNLVQKKAVGFFYVSDALPELDVLPPNRIADLTVVSINHDNRTATLQWTAPGGDYDSGKVAVYDIKYSLHPSSLTDIYFNEDENSRLEPASAFNPSISGEKESVEFQFPHTHHRAVYYVVLRAIDENNNTGEISNVIQVFFSQKETTIEPAGSTSVTWDATSPNVTRATSISSSPTPHNSTTIAPNKAEFFDEKTLIMLSSSGAIVLLIIVANLIVCCCCIRKMKRSPSTANLSRKELPYSLDIAHRDSGSASQRKFSYHTEASLRDGGSALGFELVPPDAVSRPHDARIYPLGVI